jgi:hypothetical protein
MVGTWKRIYIEPISTIKKEAQEAIAC